MRKIVLMLAFACIAFTLDATAQQSWQKKDPPEQAKSVGATVMYTRTLSPGGGYILLSTTHDAAVTVGIQYIASGNLSVVDTVHCVRKDGKIAFQSELYSARSDGGRGGQVAAPYVPLLVIFLAPLLDTSLPEEALTCYDAYEKYTLEKFLDKNKVWKMKKLSDAEAKEYGYKFVADGVSVVVSQNQEKARIVVTKGTLTHTVDYEGRYAPRMTKEAWSPEVGDAQRVDLLKNHAALKAIIMPETTIPMAFLHRVLYAAAEKW